MRIVLISTPIGFLGSGKGGGVELTLNSLVSGLLSLGHSVEVIAPKNSKLYESNEKLKLSLLSLRISICGSTKVLPYSVNLTLPEIANLVPGVYKDF